MELNPLAALAAAAVLLVACGDDGEDPSSGADSTAHEEPTSVTVTVELQDHGSLDALFNGDGGVCTSRNIAEAFDIALENPDLSADELRELLPRTTVTLKNADGSTVGLQELSEDGGSFAKGTGCDWPVTFEDVEPSDFYEVAVEHGEFSTSDQGEGGEGDVSLTITF